MFSPAAKRPRRHLAFDLFFCSAYPGANQLLRDSEPISAKKLQNFFNFVLTSRLFSDKLTLAVDELNTLV